MGFLEALEPRSGTQTIERAVGLLRYIATHHHNGCRLSTLAGDCGLRKSTAHRILACLIREGLVLQRPSDRRYVLGPMLFELGLSATPERMDLQHAARIKLAELARKTQSIAKLFFRSGDDFVCSVRVGDARLAAKDLVVYLGSRRPLCYAAGGAAILMLLPRREAFQILRRNLTHLADYPNASASGIVRMMQRSLREGIAINAGQVIPGINGIGLALCHPSGEPFGSISIAGAQDIVTLDRLDEYREMLEDTARQLWARTPAQKPQKTAASLVAALSTRRGWARR
jgi:DNA-binding IclR family transcriptional regulator